jgi:hypothetical protein
VICKKSGCTRRQHIGSAYCFDHVFDDMKPSRKTVTFTGFAALVVIAIYLALVGLVIWGGVELILWITSK